MSPKPFDLDRALATLRAESPSPEAAARARRRLDPLPLERGSRRSLARPLTLMITTAALAVVLAMPRSKAGSAWAQTLAATLDAPLAHLVQHGPDGKIRMDEWRAGARRARIDYAEKGFLMGELREDGRRRYNFFNHRAFRGSTPLNGAQYGLLYTPKGQGEGGSAFPVESLDRLLASKDLVVEGHDEADAEKGTPERYRLAYRPMRTLRLTVEIDPERRRVRRILTDFMPPTEVEYPSSAPSGVFEPRPQAAKDVVVYDLDAQRPVVVRRLREGLGKQGPVTLRLITLDADGRLWAFWTGAPPSRDLKPAFRLPGVATGSPFGLRMFTRDWFTAPTAKGNPHRRPGSPPLGGMAVVPKAKIGANVALDVPYPGGVARFRNVPVLRIAELSHFDRELGVRRTYR